jgi:hypothetical protein
LKPYKVVITNLNVTKSSFIRKFWPQRFHKIDSSRPPDTEISTTKSSEKKWLTSKSFLWSDNLKKYLMQRKKIAEQN